MNELLKALYDNFYEPVPDELKKEIEDCHQKPVAVPEKSDLKLVLQNIDYKD